MSTTLFCIRTSRTLIVLLTLIFITLSQMRIFQITIIPWPTYPSTVAIILDLCLVIGLIASLTQHLKTLIFFSWLSALTFLLIFFGNTVSSQYQSDLIGMFYLLLICILAFTDAVCIIKYRMPSEEAHHPFVKCTQQQQQQPPPLFVSAAMAAAAAAEQHHQNSDSLLVPLPPPPHHPHHAHHHHHHHPHLHHSQHHHHSTPPLPPPPPPVNLGHHIGDGGGASSATTAPPPPPSQQQPQQPATSRLTSPTSPLSPPISSLNSHCYVPKNDPQFHAV